MRFLTSKLGIYFGMRFLKALLVIFAAVALLSYTLDLFELMRRAGGSNTIRLTTLMVLSSLRLPFVIEQVLPFAVLFAAIVSFLALSRRLELVVARAAGLSAWQFISPALFLGFLVGVFAVVALNPLVAIMKDRSEQMEASIFGNRNSVNEEVAFWLRQSSEDGESVLRAVRHGDNLIADVTVFQFADDYSFGARIDAASGELQEGQWLLKDAKIIKPGERTVEQPSVALKTSIGIADLDSVAARNPNASFWTLPGLIQRLELAGLSATRYRLMLQSLYSKPLLFAAMVLIAASVSLRFFRMGGVAQLVGIGVLAGFGLYILNQIGQDLGSAGIVPVFAAAWAPALAGTLAAAQGLLRTEDG
jgi:lipopolysaccharide export system permease protein